MTKESKYNIVGFVLIGLVMFGFTWYQSRQYKKQAEYQAQLDSIARVEAMEKMVRRGETVNLRFERAEDADAFIGSVRAWIADYNENHPDAPYEGSWSAISQTEQGCVVIMPSP